MDPRERFVQACRDYMVACWEQDLQAHAEVDSAVAEVKRTTMLPTTVEPDDLGDLPDPPTLG